VTYATSAAAGAKLAVPKADIKTKDVKAKKEQVAQQAASALVFHAVAANGTDVWAGGAPGLLYHSVDSGAHWTRIVPISAGVALTGDILSIEFPDPLHGRVTTSAPEVWLTADGGRTWQKQ
jgi:photosystem II stability/assembly factor-like uncharacterized protein